METYWSSVFEDYSLRKAHKNSDLALAGVLTPFISLHNFTFDTFPFMNKVPEPGARQRGIISMLTVYYCDAPDITSC